MEDLKKKLEIALEYKRQKEEQEANMQPYEEDIPVEMPKSTDVDFEIDKLKQALEKVTGMLLDTQNSLLMAQTEISSLRSQTVSPAFDPLIDGVQFDDRQLLDYLKQRINYQNQYDLDLDIINGLKVVGMANFNNMVSMNNGASVIGNLSSGDIHCSDIHCNNANLGGGCDLTLNTGDIRMNNGDIIRDGELFSNLPELGYGLIHNTETNILQVDENMFADKEELDNVINDVQDIEEAFSELKQAA